MPEQELSAYQQWQLEKYGNYLPELEADEPDWDEIEKEISEYND